MFQCGRLECDGISLLNLIAYIKCDQVTRPLLWGSPWTRFRKCHLRKLTRKLLPDEIDVESSWNWSGIELKLIIGTWEICGRPKGVSTRSCRKLTFGGVSAVHKRHFQLSDQSVTRWTRACAVAHKFLIEMLGDRDFRKIGKGPYNFLYKTYI